MFALRPLQCTLGLRSLYILQWTFSIQLIKIDNTKCILSRFLQNTFFIHSFIFHSYSHFYSNHTIQTSLFTLLSSHLFLSITNLIILGWFSFPSLLIPFNDRLSLHSFLDSKQSDSHYLVIDSIVLNFPEGTSSSYQPLICILMVLYHLTTMFSSHDFGTHHLLSFTQCLFQNGVSSIYSVTIRT